MRADRKTRNECWRVLESNVPVCCGLSPCSHDKPVQQTTRHGRILAAAIRLDDGTIYTLPPPARHHTIMQHFGLMPTPDQQGFVTDRGEWARRKPALRIAEQAKQLIREPTAPAHGLFSEDVW